MNENSITPNEKKFCEYYVKGSAPYAGDAALCYLKIFHPEKQKILDKHNEDDMNEAAISSMELMSRPEIQEYIDALIASSYQKNEAIKMFVTESLKAIIREASVAQYRDRNGTLLSPAPLRSVAVNAAKTLADLYPIKAAQQINLNGGDGNNGVTFNIIVPKQPSDTEPDQNR